MEEIKYVRLVDALSAAILDNLDALDVEAEAVALTPEQEALLASWQPEEYPDDDEPVFEEDDYQPTEQERLDDLHSDYDLTFDLPGE